MHPMSARTTTSTSIRLIHIPQPIQARYVRQFALENKIKQIREKIQYMEHKDPAYTDSEARRYIETDELYSVLAKTKQELNALMEYTPGI